MICPLEQITFQLKLVYKLFLSAPHQALKQNRVLNQIIVKSGKLRNPAYCKMLYLLLEQ